MPRKTIPVDQLRETANRMLAAPAPADTPEEGRAARQAVSVLLESVLFSTGNYRGYKYLDSEWDVEAQELRDGYDDTRRMYL